MVRSIGINKREKMNLMDVWIFGDGFAELRHFVFPGPKGQLLLERVEQVCLEAWEEIKEAEAAE